MSRIERASLKPLEVYARERPRIRSEVMAHKKNRTVRLGDNVTLIFEDEITIRYQIQEMLYVERIFEEKEVQNELDTYNLLIPDGRNLKATMMIEYPDVEERRRRLADLIGIEDEVWIEVKGKGRVHPVCDEDLERDNAEKTSAVHFLRFELSEDMVMALKAGAGLVVGVDHPQYKARLELAAPMRESLANDFT